MKAFLLLALSAAALSSAAAFVPPSSSAKPSVAPSAFRVRGTVRSKCGSGIELNMMDPVEVSSAAVSASSLVLAETEPWVQPLANVLGPFLNIFSFAMVGDLFAVTKLWVACDVYRLFQLTLRLSFSHLHMCNNSLPWLFSLGNVTSTQSCVVL